MSKNNKKRYLRKETLAKNIVRSCFSIRDLLTLDIRIGEIYDLNKKAVEKHRDRMKKLDEIFDEYTSNPKAFVEKYAKAINNTYVLKILNENPDLYKGKKWY